MPGTEAGQPGREHGISAHVPGLLAALRHATEDHVIDPGRVEPAAGSQCPQHMSAQVNRMHAGEASVAPAHRSPDGRHDDRITHVVIVARTGYQEKFVGKKIAITSIPYNKITSVSVVSDKSWAGAFLSSGHIAINVGTHVYEMSFRGDHKSHHVHNVILHYIAR